MKKFQIVAVTTFLVASFTISKAQTSNISLQLKALDVSAADIRMAATNTAAKVTDKANFRAHQDFDMRFTNGYNVKWRTETNLLTASFSQDDVRYCAVYDLKGHWIWSMKSYDEQRMSADLRELVKRSEYFDYKILYVQEVQEDDLSIYVIYLENDNTFKKIFVHDWDITLYSTITKEAVLYNNGLIDDHKTAR